MIAIVGNVLFLFVILEKCSIRSSQTEEEESEDGSSTDFLLRKTIGTRASSLLEQDESVSDSSLRKRGGSEFASPSIDAESERESMDDTGMRCYYSPPAESLQPTTNDDKRQRRWRRNEIGEVSTKRNTNRARSSISSEARIGGRGNLRPRREQQSKQYRCTQIIQSLHWIKLQRVRSRIVRKKKK